ncbi:MAG: REP-associated tyrosine transposase [Bacteroidota bacterium]
MGNRTADRDCAYFITNVIVDHLPILRYKEPRTQLIKSLQFAVNNNWMWLETYVIMPNHWHAIVAARDRSIPEAIGGIKSFTARFIDSWLRLQSETDKMILLAKKTIHERAQMHGSNKRIQVWEHGYYPIYVESSHIWQQKRDYIHRNPVKAGLSKTPEGYLYSSAHPNHPLAEYLTIELHNSS